MSKSSLLLSGLILLSLVAVAQKKVTKPVHVIFDTDMGPDYDGAGAITMLHAHADRGEAEILATIASTKYEGVAAVLKVLILIQETRYTYWRSQAWGAGLRDYQHWTDTLIVKYPHSIKINADAADV